MSNPNDEKKEDESSTKKKEVVSGFGIAKGASSFDRDKDRDDIREHEEKK